MGLKTFATGISESGSLKIGQGVNKIIGYDTKRLKKIQKNPNISKKM
jgi:hypothetical protein